MKKCCRIFFLLIFCPAISRAQYVVIPDEVFRNHLQLQFPDCFDVNGRMDTTCQQIITTTDLDCGDWHVSSIEGVQYFKSLTYLDCIHNSLTVLPSLPSTLLYLSCYDNLLTVLPSLPPALNYLDCTENPGLQCLPALPGTLTSLYIDSSSIHCLLNQPLSLTVYHNGLPVLMPVCDAGYNPNGCTISRECNWTGAVDGSWENPANWDCGQLPAAGTDVRISTGIVTLSSNSSIRSLTVDPNATLVIATGYELTLVH